MSSTKLGLLGLGFGGDFGAKVFQDVGVGVRVSGEGVENEPSVNAGSAVIEAVMDMEFSFMGDLVVEIGFLEGSGTGQENGGIDSFDGRYAGTDSCVGQDFGQFFGLFPSTELGKVEFERIVVHGNWNSPIPFYQF